jgi:hypothetical protein
MYVTLVFPRPQPGKADEYAQRWKAILAPRVRALPGFRAGYFVGDPAANTVQAVYLWDERPGEALEHALNDFRQQCRDITTGPARREDLEVLAEA